MKSLFSNFSNKSIFIYFIIIMKILHWLNCFRNYCFYLDGWIFTTSIIQLNRKTSFELKLLTFISFKIINFIVIGKFLWILHMIYFNFIFFGVIFFYADKIFIHISKIIIIYRSMLMFIYLSYINVNWSAELYNECKIFLFQ
jgi:hypothetical protein